MSGADLAALSVSEAAARIAEGALQPSALLEASLARIAKGDEAVRTRYPARW